MPALNCFVSKDQAKENSSSPTNQPAEKSVLPPFSEKLSVDENLKVSHENFKHTIYDFFKDKYLTPLRQLKKTPVFPTLHVLAQFASKAYTDYKKRETDAQYETRLDLPDSWKLLTTASNSRRKNGYFGAAYWHPEHQQVVIAHRGTANVGAVWTGVKGVLLNKYVRQMESASTFAHKVVEVLREVNQEKGTNFQAFFTGHSLGGWLAQITNFTTKYLKIEENTFLKSENVSQSFHPHTAIFDSPGCKEMLSQMRDTFDVRHDGRSIDLEHLDITSYLSAPNRINTCNNHVGTIYRIFPDFSDMGWLRKYTALYNSATHSMDKIVDFFDPEKGKEHKDGQGKPKIQAVVDWPVADGLSRGKEYKDFFTWAKHLNNYEPQITDKTFSLKGYNPLRYRTKIYEEGMSRLNIFSQEECQFLESYRQICQLPELFKPKELFSEIEDNEVQEQAVNILKGFEIENDKIRCTGATALQALIPYVKRLLQLFPDIKENTKCALSPNEIRNNVYQIGTKHYLEKFQQSPLEFTPDALTLGDFLNSDQEKILQLRMLDGDAWTGLIKVYQVLEKKGRLSEGHYTVLTLEHLLLVNRMVNLNTLLESTTAPHLLMMMCETRYLFNDETRQILSSLFNSLKKNQSVKIILTTQSEDDTVNFLQDLAEETIGNGFVTRDEQLTWCDLSTIAQEKLLEKPVKFQSVGISLNELMSAESAAAKFLPLHALLEEKELTIADPLPISNGYNEGYYIARNLCHQKTIKEDIFNDQDVRNSHVYLVRSKEEYTKLCQMHPKSNVHWVDTEKSEKIFWQQSQGSLETVRRYIDTDSSHTYSDGDLDKLLEQAQHQSVMLISDTAGMGKSTVMTHLSKQIKQKFPAKWVVRIDLNDHTDALKALKEEEIDKEKAIEFVSEKLLKLMPGLEMELFKHYCEQKQKVGIVIMLDGFDEISPFYKETVIDLLQALRQTAVEQLWVTTRPHLREKLEDKLQQLSYTLEPFSEKDQVEFLTKFWGQKDWFTEPEEKEEDVKKKKLEIYAEHLIKKLFQSIRDKDKQFTRIPLQTRMLAEAFDEEAKTFFQSVESTPELPFDLGLLGLYERFIERKYDIYQEEKFRVRVDNVVAIEQREREFKNMREDHQLLALKVLFTEEQLALLQSNRECAFSAEQLTRIGIVQVSDDGKPQFIHRIFAEYYVADYLMKHLSEWNTSEQVLDFILNTVMLEAECRVIRVFINAFLSRSQPSDEVKKHYGSRIHALGTVSLRLFHKVADERDVNIIGLLLDCLLEAGDRNNFICMWNICNRRPYDERPPFKGNTNRDTFYEKFFRLRRYVERNRTADKETEVCLNSTDSREENVWWKVAGWSEREDLREMWQWAEKNLTKEEINNELLLVKENEKGTVWHVATEESNLYVLQKIWEWGKDNLTREEINNKLLLAKDNMGRTVWHVVAAGGNPDVLQDISELAKENLTRGEIKNKVFLVTNNVDRTAWQVVPAERIVYFLGEIWEWAKENLTREELNNKLLLATDITGRTVWHLVAAGGKLDILQKIWELAEENLNREEINNKMLLATDNWGRTAWRVAAEWENPDVMQKIWELAKEKLTTEEINNTFLLATDDMRRNAWHVVAAGGKLDVLQKIWDLAKENLTRDEIHNKLLLGAINMGRTAWHLAAESGKLDVFEKIWEWAKEYLTGEEINNKLLLAADVMGKTAWHLVAVEGKLDVLQRIWDLAKENLTREEMYNKFLLATDNMGRTAWHVAAEYGNPDAMQKILKLAEENLTTEEIYNMLLAKNNMGRTAWHVAAEGDRHHVRQQRLKFAKENSTGDEKNNIILATHKVGRTAWHVAEEGNQIYVIQKIWEWAKKNLTREEINSMLLATDNIGRTAWHVAAEWWNVNLLEEIWQWVKKNLTTEKIINMLLTTDNGGRTTWHVVAAGNKLDAMQKIWEWAKENLTREEINNKLLLSADNMGRTAWHLAAEWENPDVMQKILELAKENLTTDEIYNNLLATDKVGRTAWHVAAERDRDLVMKQRLELVKDNRIREEKNNILLATHKVGRTDWHVAEEGKKVYVMQKIWEWAKENLKRELINSMLLATGNIGRTAWHVAAEKSNVNLLEEIWDWVKKNLTTEQISYMLLATNNMGMTTWHVVAAGSKLVVMQKIWEWAKENLTREEINNKLLLSTDNMGRTAWHVAAEWEKPDVMQKILELAKENLTTEEIRNILIATDKMGRTVWQVLAARCELDVIQKIWEWAKEKLTSEEIHNILLATEKMGVTAWHVAAERGQLDIMQKIWEWAKQNLTREEINNTLLLSTENMGRTAWCVAAERGQLDTMQKIWEWAKEILTREEINNMLLVTDNMGKTAWHVAADWAELVVMQKMWDLVKENLTREEIYNILLVTDNMGRTAWHAVAARCNVDLFQKICEWTKENLTTQETNNILLARDNMGRTAWHVVAAEDKPYVLQKIWMLVKENLTREQISNKLLLATDKWGKTILHILTEDDSLIVILKIWEWAKKNLTTEEIINKFLLATEDEGKTAWHVVAAGDKPYVLQEIWELAKEYLTEEEISNKLLLATDKRGKTILHILTEDDSFFVILKIWEWAKKKKQTEKIINKFLLATDNKGTL